MGDAKRVTFIIATAYPAPVNYANQLLLCSCRTATVSCVARRAKHGNCSILVAMYEMHG